MTNDFLTYELVKEYRVYIEEQELWVKARIVLRHPDKLYEVQISHYCKPFGANDFHSVNSIHDFDLTKIECKLFHIFLPEFKNATAFKEIDGYDRWGV